MSVAGWVLIVAVYIVAWYMVCLTVTELYIILAI